MLDDNLPTFRFRSSSDNPLTTVAFLTQNGDEPTPEYVLRRADPATQPLAHDKYAVALCDAYNPVVVYAEVVVEPEWAQPTGNLSVAELRAQQVTGAPPAGAGAATPIVPDGGFAILLHNPEQTVTVKPASGGLFSKKHEAWEFELPVRSFREPTTSALDRDKADQLAAQADLLSPRVVFRWKKDGLFSKDMSCCMCGKTLPGGRRSKEPDITIALLKAAKAETAVTIYEPNLQRVEVEDRKGLEVVMLLAAEVIRDFYLFPRPDLFNPSGSASPSSAAAGKRRNSRPSRSSSTPPLAAAPAAVSGALPGSSAQPANPSPTVAIANARPAAPPTAPPPSAATAVTAATAPPQFSAAVDVETRRLQALVKREEEDARRREKAEQKRLKRMVAHEEEEERRRQAEVARETERLRKLYGVQGQELPSEASTSGRRTRSSATAANSSNISPPLPPRHHQTTAATSASMMPSPRMPPRPASVGPAPAPGPGGPFGCPTLNSWWHGPGGVSTPQSAPVVYPPSPMQQHHQQPRQPQQQPSHMTGLQRLNPGAAVSQIFGRGESAQRVAKKRSMYW